MSVQSQAGDDGVQVTGALQPPWEPSAGYQMQECRREGLEEVNSHANPAWPYYPCYHISSL